MYFYPCVFLTSADTLAYFVLTTTVDSIFIKKIGNIAYNKPVIKVF